MSEIVQPLRFCGVLCIARSVSQPRHAQLTRCFSAVAELLVNYNNEEQLHEFRHNGVELLTEWSRQITTTQVNSVDIAWSEVDSYSLSVMECL